MEKAEYLIKTFSRTKRKDDETYKKISDQLSIDYKNKKVEI